MYFKNLSKPLHFTFSFIIGFNNGLDDVRSTDGEEEQRAELQGYTTKL